MRQSGNREKYRFPIPSISDRYAGTAGRKPEFAQFFRAMYARSSMEITRFQARVLGF